MATEVGTAYVAIIPSAKGFARTLKKAIAEEFAGSNLDKMISEALGGRKVTIPVTPELDGRVDTSALGRERVKLPVEVDRSQAASEGAAAARTAERAAPPVKLKVNVDQPSLRGASLALSAVKESLVATATTAGQVGGSIRGLGSSISGALGTLATLAGAVAATAGAFTVAVPSVYLLGGALGSLPGIAAGASAAIGALALGLHGIADAFKTTAASGGGAGQSAAAAARQIASAQRGIVSAERGLARAQREASDAQLELNRARKAAVERIEDLARSLAGARLDEEEAALQVRDAERELADARKSGNVDDIQRADLAYRRALQSLEDARDTTADLTDEQKAAAAAGVEGSDEVRSALQRQQDATDAVTAASESLTAAHEQLAAAQESVASGGAAAAAKLIKLAPAAQRFVDAVKSLKPAFESLRLGVQQKLFAGLDGTVKSLATAWFPQLTRTLGDYASTFNGLVKDFTKSVSQKSFIDNVAAGAESARKALKRIGEAVSGPLVDAFGRLARAAGPFIETLGDELAKVVEDFSKWIKSADESGKLDDFFTKASGFLRDVFAMGRDVVSIFGSIFEILTGSNDAAATSPWEALKNKLDQLAAWFDDPKNQQKIRDWIKEIKDFVDRLFREDIPKVESLVNKISGWIDTVDMWGQRIGAVRDTITGAFTLIGAVVTGTVRGMGQALAGLTTPITNAITQFGRLRDGASAHLSSLVSLAQGIPGRVSNAVGSLGNVLYGAGKGVIQGLINGIRAMFGPLQSTLGWVTAQIPNWKGPADKDARLLQPAGRLIMQGLIGGIHGERSALATELAGVTSDIAVGGTASVSAAAYRAPAAPSPARLVAEWVGGDGDPIMRAIREHTRIYYDGDPGKAFGTGARR